MTRSSLGEVALIERIRAAGWGRAEGVRTGIGDDCAVLRVPPGCEMVVTTDFSLEGRHFRRDWHTPESAGHRCLARGLSDVAAMGGRPIAAFLSLALPSGYEVGWVDGFMAGFQALAERFGVELAGGDTAQASGTEIVADVVVTGTVGAGMALLRSGARVGDNVYVTGSLGGATVELEEMRTGRARRLRDGEACPQSYPEPRVGVGQALVGIASSCMDLSDGLSTDLWQLCEASGVGAEIVAARVPLGIGATLDQALNGGEDYELLFTVDRSVTVQGEIQGVKITRIGTITEKRTGMRLIGKDLGSEELHARGWEHFRA